MPSGTSVTAWYSCYSADDCFIDVAVIPLTEDYGRVEGLCGNYNDDDTDDLTPKGSTTVDDRVEPITYTNSYM